MDQSRGMEGQALAKRELKVNLVFNVYSFFVGIISFPVYNQMFQITTTQIPEL